MRRVNPARWAVILMAGASLCACASVTPQPRYPASSAGLARLPQPTPRGTTTYKTGEPYQVGGIWYVPHEQPDYDQTGIASWYGDAFNMKATADGEVFDMNQFSAAHTTLPLPSLVEVTNLENGRRLVVRVNDRGPFVGGRIIDLSHAAASELGYAEKGLAKVRVRYVGPAPLAGPEAGMRVADAAGSQPFFHKPLATRLPVAGSPAPAVRGAPQAPSPPTVAPSAVADDGVVLTAYKSPQPVGVSTLPGLPAERVANAAAAKPDTPKLTVVVARTPQPRAPLTGADLGPIRGERIALPEPARTAVQARAFRIQAGAFASEDNAHRAAAQLGSAGIATVEPFEHDGLTYYRVFVPGADDEVAAYAIRDRVAAAGFADARVVKAGT